MGCGVTRPDVVNEMPDSHHTTQKQHGTDRNADSLKSVKGEPTSPDCNNNTHGLILQDLDQGGLEPECQNFPVTPSGIGLEQRNHNGPIQDSQKNGTSKSASLKSSESSDSSIKEASRVIILEHTDIYSPASSSLPANGKSYRAYRKIVPYDSEDEDNTQTKPPNKPVQVIKPSSKKPSIIHPKNTMSGSKGKKVVKLKNEVSKRLVNSATQPSKTPIKTTSVSKICFHCKTQSHPQEDKLLGVTWHKCSFCLRWWHGYCLPYDVSKQTKPQNRRVVPKFRCPVCPADPMCGVCWGDIKSLSDTIKCDHCFLHFHLDCLPKNHQKQYQASRKGNHTWYCEGCL